MKEHIINVIYDYDGELLGSRNVGRVVQKNNLVNILYIYIKTNYTNIAEVNEAFNGVSARLFCKLPNGDTVVYPKQDTNIDDSNPFLIKRDDDYFNDGEIRFKVALDKRMAMYKGIVECTIEFVESTGQYNVLDDDTQVEIFQKDNFRSFSLVVEESANVSDPTYTDDDLDWWNQVHSLASKVYDLSFEGDGSKVLCNDGVYRTKSSNYVLNSYDNLENTITYIELDNGEVVPATAFFDVIGNIRRFKANRTQVDNIIGKALNIGDFINSIEGDPEFFVHNVDSTSYSFIKTSNNLFATLQSHMAEFEGHVGEFQVYKGKVNALEQKEEIQDNAITSIGNEVGNQHDYIISVEFRVIANETTISSLETSKASKDYVDSKVESEKVTDSHIVNVVNGLGLPTQADLQNVRELAEGRNKAYAILNADSIGGEYEDERRIGDDSFVLSIRQTIKLINERTPKQVLDLNFKLGDNLYIADTNVPDYWVSKVRSDLILFCKLETSKVPIEEYVKKTELDNYAQKAEVVDIVKKEGEFVEESDLEIATSTSYDLNSDSQLMTPKAVHKYANDNYLTKTNASSTYETKSNASSTYATKTSLNSYVPKSVIGELGSTEIWISENHFEIQNNYNASSRSFIDISNGQLSIGNDYSYIFFDNRNVNDVFLYNSSGLSKIITENNLLDTLNDLLPDAMSEEY